MRTKVVLLILIASFNSAWAQFDPNPDCWSGDPNPDGSQVVPAINYDAETGFMSINTLGLNQIPDSPDRDNIVGDDVGMIGLVIEGPEPYPFTWEDFGVVWNYQYFNGKMQVYGVPANDQFLWVTDEFHLFPYPTGLSSEDFGLVEMAINYGPNQPGGIIFGSVNCVPEPSSWTLLVFCCLVIFRCR